MVSDCQSPKKNFKRSSLAPTREFGTQTTGNRWFQVKKRANCSIGVQVDSDISLSVISNGSDHPEETRLPSLNSEPNKDSTTNGSAGICKNCLRSISEEDLLVHNNNHSSDNDEISQRNIPNPESPKSPCRNQVQRLSFTKIRKSPHSSLNSNQRNNSITVDEPLIKNIVTTQVSPSSTPNHTVESLMSRTVDNCHLPNSSSTASSLSDTSQSSSNDSLCATIQTLPADSPPQAPPLPSLLTHPCPATSCISLPPPPPPMPDSNISPPHMPVSAMPPPPPMPESAPPRMPNSVMPPPPPMPGTTIPTPPPMLGSATPPPPPMPGMSIPPPPPPLLNGGPTPVVEQFIVSERVSESLFAPSPYKTTSSNYHTLPSRRLHSEAGFHKYNTLPKPSKKMKTLNWTKVPNQIIGK